MQEGTAAMEDPHHDRRLIVAVPAALLLGASGFFAATIALNPDGTHGPVFALGGVRTIVLVAIALLAVYFAARPLQSDPRIAQAIMLAAAVVAIVIGLDGFIGPYADDGRVVGVAPYLQIVSAAAFLTLRWSRRLWPTSRWVVEARQAEMQRTASRRQR